MEAHGAASHAFARHPSMHYNRTWRIQLVHFSLPNHSQSSLLEALQSSRQRWTLHFIARDLTDFTLDSLLTMGFGFALYPHRPVISPGGGCECHRDCDGDF